MHLVEEKMGVTAVDEDDELVLDFCRLAGGAVDELFEVDILLKKSRWQISEVASKSDTIPPKDNKTGLYGLYGDGRSIS
jgi:hypothetical protein